MHMLKQKHIDSSINSHRNKRSWKLLTLGIFSFILLALLIYFVPPATSYTIYSLHLSVILGFFLLLFIFLFAVSSYLFKSKIHGILIATLAITYLIFRQNDLTHPFFALLLLALFLVLELLFTYRK